MSTTKIKKKPFERKLPLEWRPKVIEILAAQGIQKTKGEITKIVGGYIKNDEHTKQVLEAVLKVKENYKKEKEVLEALRNSIKD